MLATIIVMAAVAAAVATPVQTSGATQEESDFFAKAGTDVGAKPGPYTHAGTLTDDALANVRHIPLKGGIQNPQVIRTLTRDGSSIDDWGKFGTRDWYDSPSGSFQPHFYRNKVTGQVNYDIDYKSVFHPKSPLRQGGVR